MTLYHNPFRLKQGSRKLRRFWRRSQWASNQVRANFAYGRQWKRYPHCREIVTLQVGLKTHTGIIPEGSYGLYRESLPEPALRRAYDKYGS